MKETPQQYVRRILGQAGTQAPLKVQRATPRKLERLLDGLTRSQMRKRPAPGKWSIAEIVAHLADAELVGGYRIRMMLSKSGTRIQAMDQEDWARDGEYQKRDPGQSLATFRALREHNLRLLKSIPRGKWSHYGLHAERGRETIKRYFRLYAGHDLNHLRQIAAIRKSLLRRKA